MTLAELRVRLWLEYLRVTLHATFDTRPLTAIRARFTELGESENT
jgi:hypothetical protein